MLQKYNVTIGLLHHLVWNNSLYSTKTWGEKHEVHKINGINIQMNTNKICFTYLNRKIFLLFFIYSDFLIL